MLPTTALAFAVAIATVSPPSDPLPPGRYGLVMTFVTEADAPIVGKVTTSTTSTALVDIARDGSRVMATQRACGMTTNGGLFSLRASPAFVKALAPATYELVVDGDRVRADLGVAAVGVDPKAKTLPRSRDDKAFLDPDKDGRKGVPLDVDVGGMKLHIDIATLGQAVLVGTLKDGGIEGRPKVVFAEERILGGIPEVLAGGSKHVVEDKSSFSLQSLAPGATCATVEHMSNVARAASPGTSRG